MTQALPQAASRLVSPDGRALPLRDVQVDLQASGGLARLTLRQRFVNPWPEPLRVTLQVPLPADAAVMGFAFELGEERIVGEVERREVARERFEEALLEGRSAALLEEERSSLFSQEVGNVPPFAELHCELVLDLLLAWEEGGWTLRLPLTAAPRYLGETGRVPDAARLGLDVVEGGTSTRLKLQARIEDPLAGPLTSPSHPLRVDGGFAGLADPDGIPLDRDLVLRWPVAALRPGLSLRRARSAAGHALQAEVAGLLTVVPPARPGPALPRDLVLLLDTSGSMSGAPLAQAVAVSKALIETLGPQDQLQMIEFSTAPRAWRTAAVSVEARHRQDALRWLDGLRAAGGTEMRAGIEAALAALRPEAQRQVVLITDGLIGFEREIIGAIAARRPRACRVHTVGIGSSVNRSLLAPAARAGGGVEVIIGLEESPREAARRLVAATASPLLVDLELDGEALAQSVRAQPPDLMAGQPLRLALRLRPEGGALRVRARGPEGSWEERIVAPPTAPGEGDPALIARLGRERADELELRAALGEDVDEALARVGLDHQVSTRRTSWVAIRRAPSVDPRAPGRRERLPLALPHGMSAEGLGLRACAAPPPAPFAPAGAAPGAGPDLSRSRAAAPGPSSPKKASLVQRLKESFSPPASEPAPKPAPSLDRFDADEHDPDVAHRYHDARLVLARGDRLVLELEVGALTFIWRPGARVILRLTDGSERPARLDRAASTARGFLSTGMVLRVVLEVEGADALGPRLREVEIDADTEGGILRLHLYPHGRA